MNATSKTLAQERHTRACARQKKRARGPKAKPSHCVSWHDSMVYYVARGVSISGACGLVGISRSTYYRHLKADPDFELRIAQAQARLEMELLSMIREGGREWRRAAWLLEKRDPRNWGTAKDRLRFNRCTCGAAGRL